MKITDFRLKIRNFYRKYKIVILIVVVAWIAVLIVNYLLGKQTDIKTPITTYKPHTAVMDSSKVPEKLQSPIEQLIQKYIEACNQKDYETAYQLLTDDCKKNAFSDNIENFEEYVDSIFDTKKIYNIQDFSNKDNTYIYTVTILNDIMASGMTNEELETYEETMTITDKGTDSLQLSVKGYIKNENVDKMYEDDYIKINVTDVKVDYETLIYHVTIKNKTENTVVIEDFSDANEIYLDTNYGKRNRYGLSLEPVALEVGETKNYDFTFTKYYDEKAKINGLVLANIRILPTYTGTEENRQSELDQAKSIYSVTLDVP